MAFVPSSRLVARVDELLTHYPPNHRRAGTLWLCHLVQDEAGHLGDEQIEWIANKLGLSKMDVNEVVTFYPMFRPDPSGKVHLRVCRSLSCDLGGCGKLFETIKNKLGIGIGETTPDGLFTVTAFECLADCSGAPAMMVNDQHLSKVSTQRLEQLIDEVASTKRVPTVPVPPPLPPHSCEKRVLLGNISKPGYTGSLQQYVAQGGYKALRKALTMDSASIINEVKTSGLRGRGGAGFPTGVKWSFVDRKSGKPVYLICNGDESEPGTFKDRVLLHYDPHQLIEGMAIAAHAIGSNVGYIYLRGEFTRAVEIMEAAIAEAKAAGYLGKNIQGSGFDLELYMHRGAGAYICGEETGLIESLEGKRAYPRIKPPFPAVSGLFSCPTVVNNVETLCNIPHIINNGGAWFASMGVQGSTGTRIMSVSGNVQRPGYFEIENGSLTLRELIFDVCGGPVEGRKVKGVIPGGSSMPILLPEQLDVKLDFDSIQKAGSMAGSGGVIVLDEAADVISATHNISQFYAHESCGQCTPCREGTLWMNKVLYRINTGKGRKADVPLLLDIANQIDGKTICPLGEAAAWPVRALVTKYRSEFEAKCSDGKETP
jgi:NADH-quinone oxidoreductase subunit F